MFRAAIIALVVALFCNCGLSEAQQKQPPEQQLKDLKDLEIRLRDLESRVEGTAKLLEERIAGVRRTPESVLAIAEIAKLTLESTDKTFATIRWFSTAASVVIAVIIGGFALFGYRRFSQIVKPMGKQHRELMKLVEDERAKLAAITTELDIHKKNAVKDADGLIHVTAAFSFLMTGKDDQLLKALREVDRTIDGIKPTHPTVLSWAHGIKGFILKRMTTTVEALAEVERAIEIEPTNESALYNCACYAAILNERAKWIVYLKRSIALNAQFAMDARNDPDFRSVHDDPDFRVITGQARLRAEA